MCRYLEGSSVQKGLNTIKINCHCGLNQLLYKLTENSPSLPSQGLSLTVEKQNKRRGRRVRAQSISKSHLWAWVSLVHWFLLRHMMIMTRGEWFYGSLMSTLTYFLPHHCGGVHFLSLWRGSIFNVCSWELFLVTKPNSQRSTRNKSIFQQS